jgi:hypothetical protein
MRFAFINCAWLVGLIVGRFIIWDHRFTMNVFLVWAIVAGCSALCAALAVLVIETLNPDKKKSR